MKFMSTWKIKLWGTIKSALNVEALFIIIKLTGMENS